MISEDSLLTIVLVFLSQSTGTVTRPLNLRIRRGVELVQELRVDDRVGNHSVAFVERPALAAHEVVDHRQPDHVLEPLELSEDQRAMRPGARIGDVEMVAPGFCLERLPLGAFVPSAVIQFLNLALVRTNFPPVLLVSYQTSRQTPSTSFPMSFPFVVQSKWPMLPLW